jgi:transglutaminase-like putative cysteine protease
MQVLTVRHLTVYEYSQPVELGEHRMMFRPRESHDLRLLSTQLAITPQPSSVRWLHDVFDNSLAVATFDAAASVLRFDSTVTLEHVETLLPDYALEAEARRYPFQYAGDELPDLERGLVRRHPSEDIAVWARRFLRPDGSADTIDLLRSITRAIKDGFRYERREEKGIQSPSETLQRCSGSCRDFALLMIEASRCLGFAARFVSGYIFVPHADPGGLTGGGATHAWMQAYLPGAGWVDFDPTNNIVGNRNLIRVAVAWDPKQVLPLWGTFVGAASSFLGMSVRVSVTEHEPAVLAP